MKNFNRSIIIASLLVLVILIFPTLAWSHSSIKNMEQRHNSQMSPVIWVPGSSADQDRFDDIFKTINTGSHVQHSVLKVEIMKNDTIKYTGSIRPNDLQPFIVVAFEDNSDGYTTIKKESRWFNIALQSLVKRYNFNNFKAIGHSNGGLVLSFFLEDYNNSDEVHMTKLLTMGSPFNSYEDSLSNKTVMLNDLINNRSKIDKNLTVYSITGTEDYSSDGTVPEASVEAGKYVFQKQVKKYTQITVTGTTAAHSDLPSNPETLDIINKNIISKDTKKKAPPAPTQDIKHKHEVKPNTRD